MFQPPLAVDISQQLLCLIHNSPQCSNLTRSQPLTNWSSICSSNIDVMWILFAEFYYVQSQKAYIINTTISESCKKKHKLFLPFALPISHFVCLLVCDQRNTLDLTCATYFLILSLKLLIS